MDSSARETDINPYLPPSETDDPTAPKGPPVLKDLRLRGWLAISAISLQSVIHLAALVSPGLSDEMIHRLRIVNVALGVLSMILFLRWLLGVAVNTLRINPLSGITPGWIVGSYFVPFVNWVLPCIHMRAFIRECHPQGASAGMQGLAVAWWVSFLFHGSSNLSMLSKGGRAEMLIWGILIACTLVSWVTSWFLITRITRRHYEFRWSDFPATQRPISLEEQSRLIHQMDADGKPDSPPPP